MQNFQKTRHNFVFVHFLQIIELPLFSCLSFLFALFNKFEDGFARCLWAVAVTPFPLFLSANCWPTVCVMFEAKVLANCWQRVGNLLAGKTEMIVSIYLSIAS